MDWGLDPRNSYPRAGRGGDASGLRTCKMVGVSEASSGRLINGRNGIENGSGRKKKREKNTQTQIESDVEIGEGGVNTEVAQERFPSSTFNKKWGSVTHNE